MLLAYLVLEMRMYVGRSVRLTIMVDATAMRDVSWISSVQIGRPNTEILHHGPPPAYARGQAAVGGAERPRVHPGIRCVGCAPRRGACERRAAAAGRWQVALAAAKFARL